MKRILALLMTFFILFGLTSCSQENNSSSEPEPSIPLPHPNVYTWDTQALYRQIADQINAKDDLIAVETITEVPTVDLVFTPDGSLLSLTFWLRAVEKNSTDTELQIGQFAVKGFPYKNYVGAFLHKNIEISGLDIPDRHSTFPFAVDEHFSMAPFNEFHDFMTWLNTFDLKSCVEQNKIGAPSRYILSRRYLDTQTVLDPDAIITWLDASSSNLPEIPLNDILSNQAETVLFTLKNKIYYLLIPYYVQDGTLKGFDEQTLGQSETTTFIANNAIAFVFDQPE